MQGKIVHQLPLLEEKSSRLFTFLSVEKNVVRNSDKNCVP